MTYPKIELHVHLEGSVRPRRLLEIAKRNGVALPADTEEELAKLYRFRDFAHFIEIWIMTSQVIRAERDFREIVVDYAGEAAAHGAVYVEGIFSPAERVKYGVTWDEAFSGACDGVQEAKERFDVTVRLTPDIPRDLEITDPHEGAERTVTYASKYRERGVVGVGLGGLEKFPPEPFAATFRRAKDEGLGSVPHAGEVEGPASIRGALDALGADRIRHGIRAIEDAELLAELAEREIVLDVCPTSNVRTGAVASIEEHPLPNLLEAGVRCTLNTDDPAMFGTDLGREHEVAAGLGVSPRLLFEAGVAGALCDDAERARLSTIAQTFDWSKV
jgi:aminodeoxyfutalosine deaminase